MANFLNKILPKTNTSDLCAFCNKLPSKSYCRGCSRGFCSKDFKEHEQQLSTKFNNEIVRKHSELLDQLKKLEESNISSSDLFVQIEEWKRLTMKSIKKAADKARDELMLLINKQTANVKQQLKSISSEITYRKERSDFLEQDIDQLKSRLNELQRSLQNINGKGSDKITLITNDQVDWNGLIYIRDTGEQPAVTAQLRASFLNVRSNARWQQDGVTVAGGNGKGNAANQLANPNGLYVDENNIVYIADQMNHRIMEWKPDTTSGQVVAGGNGQGNELNQLSYPLDVIIDKTTDSLLICDNGNARIIRWPRQNGTSGEIMISQIDGWGLTMDETGALYVVDEENHEVRRYRRGESRRTVVAGSNGNGSGLDQLSSSRFVFVDHEHSVYVSDGENHRVMKWVEGAKQGIVVAGGRGEGSGLAQLSWPRGIVVDQLGTVYVADGGNSRIMRWPKGAIEGTVIIGGNGMGRQSNQLHWPFGVSFDRHGNLYVSDYGNHRVQKFSIDLTT